MAKSGKKDNSDSRIASLRLQDKEYKEMYRKWQIEHKNDYGFYFLDNSDELTYRDGEGIITESPEAAERSAVAEIHSLIANFLIIYTVINVIIWAVSKLTPLFFERITVFYDDFGFFTGDETGALTVSYLVNIAKRITPLFYLMTKTKMPAKMLFSAKIYNKPLFLVSIPMAMLSFGVFTMVSGVLHAEMAVLGLDTSVRIWMPQNRYCLVMSALLSTVVIPLLSELIHRGILMQILKQFGDGYALVATSLIAAVTTGNYRTFLYTFVMSMVIGYFSLRSGSIITAFVMRIITSFLAYTMNYLRYADLSETVYMNLMMGIILANLIIGFIGVCFFVTGHSNKINLPVYEMYLSDKERLMCCLSNPSVIIWLSMSVTFMIVGADLL